MKNTALIVALAILLGSWWGWAEEQASQIQLPARVTVTTLTNVVSGDNARGCLVHWRQGPNGPEKSWDATLLHITPAIGGASYQWPAHDCQPPVPPTERWTIATLVRRVVLVVEWQGKELTHVEETVTASTTNRWKLAQEWRPAPH